MKILHVIDERRSQSESERTPYRDLLLDLDMQPLGFEVAVLSASPWDPASSFLQTRPDTLPRTRLLEKRDDGRTHYVLHHPVPTMSSSSGSSQRFAETELLLGRLLERLGPDVVHVHGWPGGCPNPVRIATAHRIPSVVGFLQSSPLPYRELLRELRCASVVLVSPSKKQSAPDLSSSSESAPQTVEDALIRRSKARRVVVEDPRDRDQIASVYRSASETLAPAETPRGRSVWIPPRPSERWRERKILSRDELLVKLLAKSRGIERMTQTVADQQSIIRQLTEELDRNRERIDVARAELDSHKELLGETEASLAQERGSLQDLEEQLEKNRSTLEEKETELHRTARESREARERHETVQASVDRLQGDLRQHHEQVGELRLQAITDDQSLLELDGHLSSNQGRLENLAEELERLSFAAQSLRNSKVLETPAETEEDSIQDDPPRDEPQAPDSEPEALEPTSPHDRVVRSVGEIRAIIRDLLR